MSRMARSARSSMPDRFLTTNLSSRLAVRVAWGSCAAAQSRKDILGHTGSLLLPLEAATAAATLCECAQRADVWNSDPRGFRCRNLYGANY